MKLPNSIGHQWLGRREMLLVALAVTVILLVLFHRSFAPGQTLFSNDNPLGLLMAYTDVAPTLFTGHWHPFNWIGSREPSALPTLSYTLYLIWGAVVQSKFIVPVALLTLALGAWLLLRELGLGRWACALGAVAAMLNTDPFSYSCWGLPSLAISMGATFLALAALARLTGPRSWIRVLLAGFALGMAINEGFDNGAIFSFYVAAFVLFQAWTTDGSPGRRVLQGVAQVLLVALCAGWIAAHGLSTLVTTQIQGIAGMEQDTNSKEQRWQEATTWSLPKIETLRVIIPGLFGYRMDTPDGGNYWGAVGQTPGVPQSRHSGAGVYAGVLVILLAVFALVQAARRSSTAFTNQERKMIWFWTGAALVSLLLAYGRHAPFYQLFYQLPYMSTIRNPIKFMHPFAVAVVVLFAYGVEALWREYVSRKTGATAGVQAQFRAWWKVASAFERRWTIGSLAAVGIAGIGWLLYVSSRRELEGYLQSIASPQLLPPSLVPAIAKFSITEVGWFFFFLALSLSAVLLIVAGVLSGPKAKWAGVVLGVLLLADLFRANAPWIVYYDYIEKYASNPVLDLLRENPQAHRVAVRLAPLSRGSYLVTPEASNLFAGVVDQEWLEKLFPYYRVQSLDIVQKPRIPTMDLTLMKALAPGAAGAAPLGRMWQLTSTRYVLGMAGFLNLMNQQIDPTNQSFRVKAAFDFAPRTSAGGSRAEDITTVIRPEGQFALFEYGAALPHAKLFAQWEVVTNETTMIQRLVDPAFDPQRVVLVSSSVPETARNTNQAPGSVSISEYKPKRVVLKAEATSPSVLLLNDKYEPNWKVFVDGQPAELLRCNYLMRGVHLSSGVHEVQFRFDPPHGTLYVTLGAVAVALVLSGLLAIGPRQSRPAPTSPQATVAAGTSRKSKF